MQPYKVLIPFAIHDSWTKYRTDILDCYHLLNASNGMFIVSVTNYTRLTAWILQEELTDAQKFEAMRVFNPLYAVTKL